MQAEERSTAERKLAERLQQIHNEHFSLTLTDNRRSMIRIRIKEGRRDIRLHHMFAKSDEVTLNALSRFVFGKDKKAASLVRAFIQSNQAEIKIAPKSPQRMRYVPKYYDVQRIYEKVNQTYFEGTVKAEVEWGRGGHRKRQRHIRFGSCDVKHARIRMHPVLDQPWVPEFFIEYIMYHELLHLVVPAKPRGRQKVFHTHEFRQKEALFDRYDDAIAWEKKHVSKLLKRE